MNQHCSRRCPHGHGRWDFCVHALSGRTWAILTLSSSHMPINWLTRMLPRLFRDWKGEQARYDEVGIVYGQFLAI